MCVFFVWVINEASRMMLGALLFSLALVIFVAAMIFSRA